MMIESLKWDSVFFGFPVGKIRVSHQIRNEELKTLLQASSFRLIYVVIEEPKKSERGKYGDVASLVDNKLIYGKVIDQAITPSRGPVIYDGPTTTDLEKLAWISGGYSRFRNDTRLRPRFQEMYSEWIGRSVNRELADAVYVEYEGGRIVGCVTVSLCNAELAQIGLIAVLEEYRGVGIAGALLNSTEAWCCGRCVRRLRVATQGSNKRACNFYERHGFKVEEAFEIYHYWNGISDS